MAQMDLEINRNARRVLVRHWVDIGRISMSSANGRITLRGTLMKIPGQGSTDLIAVNVGQIFSELKNIQNVKWVNAYFDNWTDANGSWLPVEQKQKAKSVTGQSSQTASFDLTKDH